MQRSQSRDSDIQGFWDARKTSNSPRSSFWKSQTAPNSPRATVNITGSLRIPTVPTNSTGVAADGGTLRFTVHNLCMSQPSNGADNRLTNRRARSQCLRGRYWSLDHGVPRSPLKERREVYESRVRTRGDVSWMVCGTDTEFARRHADHVAPGMATADDGKSHTASNIAFLR